MSWFDTTQRIREANPLEEVAEEYGVDLKRVGKELRGLCPFPDHADTTPSFYINPAKQVFHCHGCGRGGSVFDFVAALKVVPFAQARGILAKRAGINVKSGERGHDRRGAEQQLVWEAAVEFWQTQLTSKHLDEIRKKWGISAETARTFRLGYSATGLYKVLRDQGLSRSAILKSVLFRETQGHLKPFFRKRLVFPIVRQGRVVNLVGRIFPDQRLNTSQPKFLKLANPEEGDPLPSLFNTDAVRPGDRLAVVEGYSDVLALHQVGFPAIALGGTQLSDDALIELARYAKSVPTTYLFLDFDHAGQEAARNLAKRLLNLGVHARLVSPPAAELGTRGDPADLIKAAGAKAKQRVNELLRAARLFVDAEIESIAASTPPTELSARLREPLLHIAQLDRITRDAYINVLAKRFKLSARSLRHELEVARKQLLQCGGGNKELARASYYVLAPSLGLMGDHWYFVLPVGTRLESRFVQVPYLVTSGKSWLQLDEGAKFKGRVILLRSDPFFTEDDSRWPLSRVKRFLKSRKKIKPRFVFRLLRKMLAHYIEFQESELLSLVAVWIVGTYLYPLFTSYPYLQVHGPAGSGKTKLLTIEGFLTFNGMVCSSLRPAGLFRIVERSGATLLLDEADRLNSRDNPELVEILRAGYKRPSYAIRVQDQTMEPRRYDVYGPKAIANISGIEDVLGSRCIPIPMVRTLDALKANRGVTVRSENWPRMRSRLYRFAMDHFAEVKAIYDRQQEKSELPSLHGRNFELWAAIWAIAMFLEKKGCKGLTEEILRLAIRRANEQKTTSLSDWDTAILLGIYELKKGGQAVITTDDVKKGMKEFMPADETIPSSRYIGATIRRLGLAIGRKVMGRYKYRIPLKQVVDRMKRYDVVYETAATKERDKVINEILRDRRKHAA